MKIVVLVTLALLGASQVYAQDAASDVRIIDERDIQLDAAQARELTSWIRDVRAYRNWYETHRNRVVWTSLGNAATRKALPAVLDWLPEKCDVLAEFSPRPRGTLAEGCDWLSYYRSNFTVDPTTQQALQTQKQNEQDPHSAFWKHVHLDAGWTSMDPRYHTYGLVGMHLTLPELAKRIQIFIPPGFLLLSMPDGHGGREFQPAATIGVSIKMFRFEFPGNSPGTAYFNLAKAYVISQASPAPGTKGQVDLVGMSFSWGR